MRFFIIPLLLAAAASAEIFQFVGQHGQSTVYGVRGAVTVGVQKLTGEKTALEYTGSLALEQVREGEYLAKFTQFSLGKYDKINRNINDETFGDLKPEEQRLVKALREQGVYEHEMQKPVKFVMKEGKVVRIEAAKDHQQWSLNIYRGIFTLLQNQARKPATLAVPAIEYKYEDGITGHCKVQYEILSQPDGYYGSAGGDHVYNMTKTVDYKDCRGRPVYRHVKDVHRGCAGVCDNHKPQNFLGQYEEEKTDFELKPTPGCPVNQQRQDSLVTVNSVAKYNVSGGYLEEARAQSIDIYRLFGGEIEVFTHLQLRVHGGHTGPKIEEPKNVQTYTTLQQRLPIQEEEELDIPVYALMKEHAKQYPQYFQKHFDAVVQELRQQQQQQQHGRGGEKQSFDTPAYMVELIQAVSGMTEEELKKTIPQSVRQQQPQQLSEDEQLRRQLWIELIGKAGSKSAVKIATEFIKNKTFTPVEARRVLQDIAGFQSYPDTDMIEQLLALCTKEGHGLTSTGKATACVAAGKVISKACNSKVFQWGQKSHQQKMQYINGKHQSMQGGSWDKSESGSHAGEYYMSMGRLAIKPELRCTPEKLQQYVERLSHALRSSTSFSDIVAYINGLGKTQKPEALPELIGYVNGTAPNMQQLREQQGGQHGGQHDETVELLRRVAIMSLRDIAAKYPKEVNPIVRVIYQDTTEHVQTRLIAFDVWMNTQPAQWEVEKVMQVANKDVSVELTHYVYTALKTAMHAEEPCYQLLAQRIRAAWTQIRPFDSGVKYSQFRSKSFYNPIEDFGVRGIWKVITSNATVLPAYTQFKFDQVRGPFMKTLFGAKLLVKGGDKIWNELTGKDGLLERIAHAINGQVKTGDRQKQTQQLLKDIAQGMDLKKFDNGTPKAVLFWRLFSGEAVIPIDAEYVNELKQELLHTVSKYGKQGVSGHFLRVLVPTKAFHVEPSSVGFPIVHSTIHPIVISVRYENVKLHYKNQEGRVLPETLELSGSIKPTVLSYRQSRVFVAEKSGESSPTVKASDVNEFTFGVQFNTGFEFGQRRFKLNVKPMFERVFHSAHCTELKLEKNTIVDEQPRSKVVDYGKCVKSLYEPISFDKQLGGRPFGMTLRLTGESHQPWAGLSLFGSKDVARDGIVGALLNRLASKGMKQHAISLYLEADKQQPMNEWSAVVDMDSNIEQLAKIPVAQQAHSVQKVKVQYQPRGQGQLNTDLQQVIGKIEALLHPVADEINETTIEKQLLIKLEGRYQGQARNTIKVAMKNIYNFERTQQQFALAAESPEWRKSIEMFANVSYPKMGSVFHYDPTYSGDDERMNGTLIAKLGGEQQEQTYRVKFQATKSDEQRKESELEWYEVRCLAEQTAGKDMSDACKKAILKDNSLDRMEIAIQLPKNVDPRMEQLAKQALTAVKYHFYPHMQTDISGRQYQQQQQQQRGRYQQHQQEIRISANATRQSQWSLLYNVRIETPRENVTLSNIRLPGFRPVHMQLSAKQQLQHVVARGGFGDVCVVGEKAVRTYDNVTFGLDVRPGCEYLMTRDQTQGAPDFTVTFKVVDPETSAKLVRVQLYDTVIELAPFTTADRYFNINVNGVQQRIARGKPVVFHYGSGNKRVLINAFDTANAHHGSTIELYAEEEEILVLFDGHSVLSSIDTTYKGHVNGICGNNDNEPSHEFIGPHGREYQHANEFIASYGIGQTCQTPVTNTKEQMMTKLTEQLKQIREQEQRKGVNMREQMLRDSDYQSQPKEWQHEMKEFFHGNQDMDYMQPTIFMTAKNSGISGDGEGYTTRTGVVPKDQYFCFTAKPVTTCKWGYHKEGVLRTERVEAFCLRRDDTVAHKAMQQIRQHQTIDMSELENKKVKSDEITVKIPKCVRHL